MKKYIIGLISGLILACGVTYAVETLIDAKSISYESEYTEKDNVSDALSDILKMVDNGSVVDKKVIFEDGEFKNGYSLSSLNNSNITLKNDKLNADKVSPPELTFGIEVNSEEYDFLYIYFDSYYNTAPGDKNRVCGYGNTIPSGDQVGWQYNSNLLDYKGYSGPTYIHIRNKGNYFVGCKAYSIYGVSYEISKIVLLKNKL